MTHTLEAKELYEIAIDGLKSYLSRYPNVAMKPIPTDSFSVVRVILQTPNKQSYLELGIDCLYRGADPSISSRLDKAVARMLRPAPKASRRFLKQGAASPKLI
jgi:hypothetical protein